MTDLIPSVQLPSGKSGPWTVEKFTVTEDGAAMHNLRAMLNRHRGETMIYPGEYTRLLRGGTIIMSDTPGEKQDHETFVRYAAGKVLIAGLGLGMVTNAVLLKPNVKHVTVVEIDSDVIKLVGPHLPNQERLEVVNADIWEWKPRRGARYSDAWFDIWPDICEDNLDEMQALKKRFRTYCKHMGFWSENRFRVVNALY